MASCPVDAGAGHAWPRSAARRVFAVDRGVLVAPGSAGAEADPSSGEGTSISTTGAGMAKESEVTAGASMGGSTTASSMRRTYAMGVTSAALPVATASDPGPLRQRRTPEGD